ncbi:MAG: hypothetical protein OXB84_02220 [Halobacteriovoraceae bacterium]|nr:hypothetical protein [Halobacteriovoraceae bacterium]
MGEKKSNAPGKTLPFKPVEKESPKKVIVGVTGKMDSIMAVYLLKKQGYHCTAISVLLSDYLPDSDMPKDESPIFGSCYIEDLDPVKEICDSMKIPFYGVDAQNEHRDQITDLAIESRLDGQEFNPYPYCYRIIMDILLKKMEYFKADYIATGHYAKISHNRTLRQSHLFETDHREYDQTYHLGLLTPRHLEKLILPLSEIGHKKLKKMAKTTNIDFIKKPPKDDLVFTQGDKFPQFIEGRVAKTLLNKGNIYNYGNAMTLGDHSGVHHYYLGQNNLPIKEPHAIDPEYQVVNINRASGNVFVNINIKLKFIHCYLIKFNPNCNLNTSKPLRIFVKLSLNGKKIPASIFFKNNDTVLLEFEKKQSGLLPPGRFAVLYNKDEGGSKILGSGIVRSSGILEKNRFHHLPKLETDTDYEDEQEDYMSGNII